MTTLYKYKIWCTTDSKWEYKWDTEAPTTCPTNNTHSVNTSSISIEDHVEETEVKIKEETIPTGGNFVAQSISFIAATGPNVTTTNTFSWPFPISVMNIRFTTADIHYGDRATCCVGPNTVIGALAANAATGATGCAVTSTVIDNIMVGYYCNLLDGSDYTSNQCGRIIGIDTNTNIITWETPLTQSFSALSPTYVRMTVYVVNPLIIGPPGTYIIGDSKIGGSYVPANVTVRVDYTNNSNASKDIFSVIEYLY